MYKLGPVLAVSAHTSNSPVNTINTWYQVPYSSTWYQVGATINNKKAKQLLIESLKTQYAYIIRLLGLFAESIFPFSQIVRYKTEYPLLLQMHMGYETRLHKTYLVTIPPAAATAEAKHSLQAHIRGMGLKNLLLLLLLLLLSVSRRATALAPSMDKTSGSDSGRGRLALVLRHTYYYCCRIS